MPTILEALNLGLYHQRAGRLPDAEAIYRAVLAHDRHNADALHLLGAIACQTGKPEAGVDLVQQAIRIRPSIPPFHNTLGNALKALHRLDEALFAFEWALRLDDSFPEAHVNLGNTLQDLGRFKDAIAHYQRALACRNDCPEIYNNLGNALRREGRLDEAIGTLRQAIALKPDYLEAHVNLSAALVAQGELEAAETCCRSALGLNPGFAPAHSNLAAVFLAQRRWVQAEASSREALRLQPEYAEAHHNLGSALRGQSRWDEAAVHYREALRLQPESVETRTNLGQLLFRSGNYPEAETCCREALRQQSDPLRYCNLAAVLAKLGRADEAEAFCHEALRLDPSSLDSHCTLGNIYWAQRRVDEADACYRAALKLAPEDPGARWNRAMILLLRGEWTEGWREYEWRWRRPDATPRNLPQPAWDGAPLEGRRIQIYPEQGMGDTVQFVRFLPLVKQAGGHVILECQPKLATLLENAAGAGQVVRNGDPLPEFDVQLPLLSLPRIFGTTIDTIPREVPYLAPDPARVRFWGTRLEPFQGYRVGLAWTGSPLNSTNVGRSLDLAQLGPLLRVPGIEFINLQKGPQGCDPRIHQVEGWDDVEDVADTAAIMMHLDLVISVDTLIAHLAGALGKPVWTLLMFAAGDFRWLLDRQDSPWYPTMRLFRQPRYGDWDSVMTRVSEALEHERRG